MGFGIFLCRIYIWMVEKTPGAAKPASTIMQAIRAIITTEEIRANKHAEEMSILRGRFDLAIRARK